MGRPVNQFLQLDCFNKERLSSPPQTLKEMEQESEGSTFGMALQLKDLFWSAEFFDADEAMEAALAQLPPDAERQANVTIWLHWLKNASYRQNIRFLNDQRSLGDALVAGDLDWITCWSSSLRELREKMYGKLALAPLPKVPSTKLKASTKLQVWSLGRNSSPKQREKALVMIDFITKPWAQKTYALAGRNSLPVNRKAAKIVAAKIPGGTERTKSSCGRKTPPRVNRKLGCPVIRSVTKPSRTLCSTPSTTSVLLRRQAKPSSKVCGRAAHDHGDHV